MRAPIKREIEQEKANIALFGAPCLKENMSIVF
jgi:hypothetical protein